MFVRSDHLYQSICFDLIKEIDFYLSLPNVSVVNAMYLCENYINLKSFCKSSMQDIKLKGKMSDAQAAMLVSFLSF